MQKEEAEDDEITRILKRPSLIITTSGMLFPDSLAGRFARKMLQKPHHAVFSTGYVTLFSFGASVQKLREGDLIKFSDASEQQTAKFIANPYKILIKCKRN